MRRRDKQIKNKEEIEAILHSAEECHIAFHDSPYPYLIPVNYAYGNGKIFFHSASEGKKIACINKNNNICFEVTSSAKIIPGSKACNWTTQYRSVIGFGKASVLSSDDEKKRGLDLIMKKFSGLDEPNYDEDLFQRMVIIKIDIDHMSAKESG